MKEGKNTKQTKKTTTKKRKQGKKNKITLTSQAVTQIQQRNQKLYGQGNPRESSTTKPASEQMLMKIL